MATTRRIETGAFRAIGSLAKILLRARRADRKSEEGGPVDHCPFWNLPWSRGAETADPKCLPQGTAAIRSSGLYVLVAAEGNTRCQEDHSLGAVSPVFPESFSPKHRSHWEYPKGGAATLLIVFGDGVIYTQRQPPFSARKFTSPRRVTSASRPSWRKRMKAYRFVALALVVLLGVALTA